MIKGRLHSWIPARGNTPANWICESCCRIDYNESPDTTPDCCGDPVIEIKQMTVAASASPANRVQQAPGARNRAEGV